MNFPERCALAAQCLPDAEYRTRLEMLHVEMLHEIGRMREALNVAAGALWRLSPASIDDDDERGAAEHARAVGLAACESILKGSA